MTKRHLTLLTAAAIVALGASAPADAGGYVGFGISNRGVSVGFGTSGWGLWASSWGPSTFSAGFTAGLSGYGEWVTVGGLGTVWRPWVSTAWRPYTHGRWVWTSLGWTWVAYEPWGWLPHHYGTWAYTTVGWVWSPGYSYHPGNVVWYSAGNHIGWMPCAPRGWSNAYRGYRHGWGNGYSHGYADGWRDARYATWVPRSRVTADYVSSVAVGPEVATRGVARSRVAELSAAPTRSQIERDVGRPVPRTRIVERTATVDGHTVRVVRPEGQETTVRRYGATTVERALTAGAKGRAAVDRNPARHVAPGRTRSEVRTRAIAPERPSEMGREVDTRRVGAPTRTSAPKSAERFVPQQRDRRPPAPVVRRAPAPDRGRNAATRSTSRVELRGRAAAPGASTRGSVRETRSSAARAIPGRPPAKAATVDRDRTRPGSTVAPGNGTERKRSDKRKRSKR